MHNAEKLKEVEIKLPKSGMTNEEENYLTLKVAKSVIRDIAKEPTLNPTDLNSRV